MARTEDGLRKAEDRWRSEIGERGEETSRWERDGFGE